MQCGLNPNCAYAHLKIGVYLLKTTTKAEPTVFLGTNRQTYHLLISISVSKH